MNLISNWKEGNVAFTCFQSVASSEISKYRTYILEGKTSRLVKECAIKRIQWSKAQGHKVVIVSASVESRLKDCFKTQGLDLFEERQVAVETIIVES